MGRLSQKLLAEFVGTSAIVLISVGAICSDQYLTTTGKPGLGTLGVALAYGMAVAAMIAALGRISGGHFNPAVTAGLWVTRRMGSIVTLLYCVVQLLGAGAAAYTIAAIVPDSVWEQVALGTPALTPDFTRTHAMALEGVAAFLWVFAFFATAAAQGAVSTKMSALAIGLTVAVCALFAYPFTGAAMNPARAFGPALASRHWTNQGVYWVGSLLGGIVAAFIGDRFFPAQGTQ